MDDFKRKIQGFRGKGTWRHAAGQTCPCCRETDKKHSRKLARARLKQRDDQEIGLEIGSWWDDFGEE